MTCSNAIRGVLRSSCGILAGAIDSGELKVWTFLAPDGLAPVPDGWDIRLNDQFLSSTSVPLQMRGDRLGERTCGPTNLRDWFAEGQSGPSSGQHLFVHFVVRQRKAPVCLSFAANRGPAVFAPSSACRMLSSGVMRSLSQRGKRQTVCAHHGCSRAGPRDQWCRACSSSRARFSDSNFAPASASLPAAVSC